MSAGDFENLERSFELPNDNLRVDYKALIEEIDTVFTIKVRKFLQDFLKKINNYGFNILYFKNINILKLCRA